MCGVSARAASRISGGRGKKFCVAIASLQKYTVRVKKPENKIFKFCDPRRVFQRARACRNIRFGSKNRKTKSSSFLARAEYFSELELAEIYGSGQKTGKQNLQVL
jgi:hypothetical protein